MLAQHSMRLLLQYRQGRPIDPKTCPLHLALLKANVLEPGGTQTSFV